MQRLNDLLLALAGYLSEMLTLEATEKHLDLDTEGGKHLLSDATVLNWEAQWREFPWWGGSVGGLAGCRWPTASTWKTTARTLLDCCTLAISVMMELTPFEGRLRPSRSGVRRGGLVLDCVDALLSGLFESLVPIQRERDGHLRWRRRPQRYTAA